MTWKTLSSRVASRPAIATTSIRLSQPAIHSAALGFEGVRFIGTINSAYVDATREMSAHEPVSSSKLWFATGKVADAIMRDEVNSRDIGEDFHAHLAAG